MIAVKASPLRLLIGKKQYANIYLFSSGGAAGTLHNG
jgi:hypothetical protein